MLLVDLGNSCIKWAQYDKGEMSRVECVAYGESLSACLDAQWRQLSAQPLALVSVANAVITDQLVAWCKQHWQQTPQQYQATAMAVGIRNAYDNPSQMGADRWAAMIAAYQQDKGPVCVVDAGTAVTLDVVDAQGQHQGGFIMPGVAALWRALYGTTARVLNEADTSADALLLSTDTILGTDTQQCVAVGIRQAISGAIEQTTQQLKSQDYGNMRYLLTGGSAPALARLLGDHWQYSPDLVLQGLALLVDER